MSDKVSLHWTADTRSLIYLHACCCLQNLNESWFASLDKHQHTPFTHFSCPCSLEQVSNFWKIIISFYAFSTFIFLSAPYKRKTFLIVFICSGQKLDTVIYNISDKLSRALKPLALEYFPPGMKLDPNMLLQQKSVGWSVGKSGWKSVTAGAPLRSVLGLVLFNIFINDPEGGAANPQHFGWWDKTGRSERLTASGVFLASTRDLNRFDKWADRNLTMSRYLWKVSKNLTTSLSSLCCIALNRKYVFPDAQR